MDRGEEARVRFEPVHVYAYYGSLFCAFRFALLGSLSVCQPRLQQIKSHLTVADSAAATLSLILTFLSHLLVRLAASVLQ